MTTNQPGSQQHDSDRRVQAALDGLGIERAHFGTQMLGDIGSLFSVRSDRLLSLTLLGPNRLMPEVMQGLGDRLLLINGTRGPSPEAIAELQPALPAARKLDFPGYYVAAWTDIAAEHTAAVADAMLGHLEAAEAEAPATSLSPDRREGEIEGITYRIEGEGPVLVLLPLFLAASQWRPLTQKLAERFCVVTLGGRHLGGVALLEERANDPSYRRAVGAMLSEMRPEPGERLLDIGCGTGAVVRWTVRHLKGANPVTALDLNDYLLGEAMALAAADGLSEAIDFRRGNAEDLPFDDGSFDLAMSHTVMEECDAERMLAEMKRIVRPGGRIGVMVRAIDMAPLWHLPLPAAIRARIEQPVRSVDQKGCADASLYARFRTAGLADVQVMPQLMTIDDPAGTIWRYYEPLLLSLLSEPERQTYHAAKAQAAADGSALLVRGLHCAVGTKPV